MEIKAGDKVRIKSWEKLLEENAEFYDAEFGEIDRGPSFVEEMQEFCGLELTVFSAWDRKEEEDSQVHTWFDAEGDAAEFTFSSWMVEEVVN